MKIIIINGELPGADNEFTSQTRALARELGQNHEVSYFQLNTMKINQCTGCWSCWWKTPGLCAIKDDAETILREIINADMVISASPIINGFTSSLLKRLQDRLIVLIHPYIELVNGECHHRKRYENYPAFSLFLEKEADTDQEDIDIITDIYKRLALNFHSEIKHIWFSENYKQEEITHELMHH